MTVSEESLMLAAAKLGPKENSILVQTFTANTSTPIDLQAVFPDVVEGRTYIDVYCAALLYYKFAPTNTDIVDETATSGPTRCFARPANIIFRELVPPGCRYMVIKSNTTAIRISLSTELRG